MDGEFLCIGGDDGRQLGAIATIAVMGGMAEATCQFTDDDLVAVKSYLDTLEVGEPDIAKISRRLLASFAQWRADILAITPDLEAIMRIELAKEREG